ncbi:MAG: flippase-like domain-containing protein [Candidatus Omnitrophica bacterium]|nr:flippase-like domain-containing protein [Candidatus Omnitrophota bacterium]
MKFFKKIVSLLFRVAISVILLFFLFQQVDRKSLLGIIKNARLDLLLFAFIIFFFSYLFCLLRWEMLLKAVKIHLSLKRIVMSFAGGVFFSLFLPSTIGGDLVRSIDLAVHTRRPREVVATVLLDRLSGYIGLVILALLSLLFGWKLMKDKSILLSVVIITALLVVILLALFNRFIYFRVNRLLHSPTAGRLRAAIKNLHQEIHYFRHHQKVIVNNLILSVLIQMVTPLTFFVIALSLGIKLNIAYFFIFLPIIGAITLLPISIGGLGLRDATVIFFFAKAGLGKDMAFAMSLLNFVFILIYGALGGLIYVLTVRHRRLQHHPPLHLQPQQ